METDIKIVKKTTYDKVIRIIDSVLSAGCLLLALQIMVSINVIDETMDTSKAVMFSALVFFALSASNVLQCVLAYRKDKMAFIKSIVYSVAFVTVGILIFALGKTLDSFKIAISVYFIAAFINRVLAIVKNHRVRSIIFNVLFGLCIFAAYILLLATMFEEEVAVLGLYLFSFILVAAALSHIISISFSQMRFGVLRKIIRKTFAAEILFGLVLLIISFSFVFNTLESQFPTYIDALWYCFAIVTTIGFGDMVATTLVGRLLSIILGLYGIVVVALITSVIVNFYSEVKDKTETELDKEEEEEELGESENVDVKPSDEEKIKPVNDKAEVKPKTGKSNKTDKKGKE